MTWTQVFQMSASHGGGYYGDRQNPWANHLHYYDGRLWMAALWSRGSNSTPAGPPEVRMVKSPQDFNSTWSFVGLSTPFVGSTNNEAVDFVSHLHDGSIYVSIVYYHSGDTQHRFCIGKFNCQTDSWDWIDLDNNLGFADNGNPEHDFRVRDNGDIIIIHGREEERIMGNSFRRNAVWMRTAGANGSYSKIGTVTGGGQSGDLRPRIGQISDDKYLVTLQGTNQGYATAFPGSLSPHVPASDTTTRRIEASRPHDGAADQRRYWWIRSNSVSFGQLQGEVMSGVTDTSSNPINLSLTPHPFVAEDYGTHSPSSCSDEEWAVVVIAGEDKAAVWSSPNDDAGLDFTEVVVDPVPNLYNTPPARICYSTIIDRGGDKTVGIITNLGFGSTESKTYMFLEVPFPGFQNEVGGSVASLGVSSWGDGSVYEVPVGPSTGAGAEIAVSAGGGGEGVILEQRDGGAGTSVHISSGGGGYTNPWQPDGIISIVAKGLGDSYEATSSGPVGSSHQWVVPLTGTYTITAKGAQGGTGWREGVGGYGARITADFDLVEGDVIHIFVGQEGESSGDFFVGGGGATWIAKEDPGGHEHASLPNLQLLLVAGGGGGYGLGDTTDQQGVAHANLGTDGKDGFGGTAAGLGGTDGSGGGEAQARGGGGAGVHGDGGFDSTRPDMGGKSLLSTGYGGEGIADGGFGGGGGVGTTTGWGAGGGGGGYSGGGGSYASSAAAEAAGGGGGSYCDVPVLESAVDGEGHGEALIQLSLKEEVVNSYDDHDVIEESYYRYAIRYRIATGADGGPEIDDPHDDEQFYYDFEGMQTSGEFTVEDQENVPFGWAILQMGRIDERFGEAPEGGGPYTIAIEDDMDAAAGKIMRVNKEWAGSRDASLISPAGLDGEPVTADGDIEMYVKMKVESDQNTSRRIMIATNKFDPPGTYGWDNIRYYGEISVTVHDWQVVFAVTYLNANGSSSNEWVQFRPPGVSGGQPSQTPGSWVWLHVLLERPYPDGTEITLNASMWGGESPVTEEPSEWQYQGPMNRPFPWGSHIGFINDYTSDQDDWIDYVSWGLNGQPAPRAPVREPLLPPSDVVTTQYSPWTSPRIRAQATGGEAEGGAGTSISVSSSGDPEPHKFSLAATPGYRGPNTYRNSLIYRAPRDFIRGLIQVRADGRRHGLGSPVGSVLLESRGVRVLVASGTGGMVRLFGGAGALIQVSPHGGSERELEHREGGSGATVQAIAGGGGQIILAGGAGSQVLVATVLVQDLVASGHLALSGSAGDGDLATLVSETMTGRQRRSKAKF